MMVHFPISYFGAWNRFAWFQRKKLRNYVQCFRGGAGSGACTARLYRRLADRKQIVGWAGFGFNFVLLAASLQHLSSVPSPPTPSPLKFGLSVTKKCFCLKGKCNKMRLHAFSPPCWLTLAKQLSRRLSKSSVTLPPYCTSPIMYRTVLHDTPCVRKNKEWFTADPDRNFWTFRVSPGGWGLEKGDPAQLQKLLIMLY